MSDKHMSVGDAKILGVSDNIFTINTRSKQTTK